MVSTSATATYEWVDHWARVPESASSRENGRTHGVGVLADRRVVVFHQAENGLVIYDPEGRMVSATGGDRWLGAHGLTRIEEDGTELLLLTDETSAEVAKVTPEGETVLQIARPQHALYEGDDPKKYVPTWAAQNPDNGEIWVADGYGASLVHRYDQTGRQIATIDGTEGAGRFACPHGIHFHPGSMGPELYITDRSNKRVVVYDGEGRFLRQGTVTHSPCCFDFLNGLVLVPELFTGVKLLDIQTLESVQEIGASDRVGPSSEEGKWKKPEGWPNLAGTEHVRPGQFNSPHGACFAPNGDIYVVEWIIGGRITKLKKSD